MEATGDRQLFNPLILRKLGLPLGGAGAQNATLPGRRYKNGTHFLKRRNALGKLRLRGEEHGANRQQRK